MDHEHLNAIIVDGAFLFSIVSLLFEVKSLRTRELMSYWIDPSDKRCTKILYEYGIAIF